jgi:hypothetical protein
MSYRARDRQIYKTTASPGKPAPKPTSGLPTSQETTHLPRNKDRIWSFAMTSCGLVHPHLGSPGEFAVPRSLRRRGYLGLRWFAAPRAFTSGAPHPRFSERGQSTANLWRNASNVALALDAPLRFAISLGDRRTSMYSFQCGICKFHCAGGDGKISGLALFSRVRVLPCCFHLRCQ